MTTDLIQHAFHGQAVRIITDEHNEPWFVLNDLCAVLGIGNSRMVAQRVDADAVSQADVTDSLGRKQATTVVSEPGMYEVVIRSDSPAAVPFRRWVTTEVLPAIRKTGQYGVVARLTKSDLAHMVIESESAREAAEAKVALLEPPARAWESLVAEAAGDYSLRDAAQILCRDHGVNTGQNRLMDTLRDWGWVDAKDVPYQRVVDQGLLRSRPRTYEHSRTNVRVLAKPQIRITTKGLERILSRLVEAS